MSIQNLQFTPEQLELLNDVTRTHKDLVYPLGINAGRIREYRQQVLGIYLRGFNYDFNKLKSTVDWTQTPLEIARQLKVSPETAATWQRAATAPRMRRVVKLTESDVRHILASKESSPKLAAKFGVNSSTVRGVRLKNGLKQSRGRPRLRAEDFPESTNWKLPSRQLAALLGVSWITADRLRTDALTQKGHKPVKPAQLPLPGFDGDRLLPSSFDGIDWTENTALLAAHLKLDRSEILRLKSLARREARTKK